MMFVSILLLLLTPAASGAIAQTPSVSAPVSDEEFLAFKAWQRSFDKRYSSLREELSALQHWSSNKRIVDAHNSINSASSAARWRASLSQFADLSEEQFRAQILLPARPYIASALHNASSLANNDKNKLLSLRKRAHTLTHTEGEAVPPSFDWRTDGALSVVTRVRDQGSVGSCWAFSAAQNIEGQWALHTQSAAQELSPEFFVDCDGTNDGAHADCSVYGGWPYLAFTFAVSVGGVPSEESWPYCSGFGKCYPCMQGPTQQCGPGPYYCDESISAKCKSFTAAAKISAWTAVSQDEEEIKEVLFRQGPLSVLIDASQLQYYRSGIWDGELPGTNPKLGCKPANLNHAVLLVGYGEEAGVPFWTVKNSWGEKWGEQGYFRITRGVGKCGINTGVTTALI